MIKHKLLIFLLFHCTILSPAQIRINEVMINPESVSDANGEWIEIYNFSDSTIDLSGWILRDKDADHHTLSIDSLFIHPGDYMILGREENDSLNGGVHVDYEYNGFILNNNQDEVILEKDIDLNMTYSISSGDKLLNQ